MLNNKKEKMKLAFMISGIVILFSAMWYFNTPKISDVSDLKAEKNIAGINELIKTCISNNKYEDVRRNAIEALVELNDKDGNKYLESYILDEKVETKVKNEIIESYIKYDNRYIEKIVANSLYNEKLSVDDRIEKYKLLLKNYAVNTRVKEKINSRIFSDILFHLYGNPQNDWTYVLFLRDNNLVEDYQIKNEIDEYSKMLERLANFENYRYSELNEELKDTMNEIKGLELYFQNIGRMYQAGVEHIYNTRGIDAALAYEQEAVKNHFKNIDKYNRLKMEAEKIQQKLNNGVQAEKLAFEDETNKKLHELKNLCMAENQRRKIDLNNILNINFQDTNNLLPGLEKVVSLSDASDGEIIFYKNMDLKDDISDIIPLDGASVADNIYAVSNNNIVYIELLINNDSYGNIINYLSLLYKRFDGIYPKYEPSKNRFMLELKNDDAVLQTYCYKKSGKIVIKYINRNYYDSSTAKYETTIDKV